MAWNIKLRYILLMGFLPEILCQTPTITCEDFRATLKNTTCLPYKTLTISESGTSNRLSFVDLLTEERRCLKNLDGIHVIGCKGDEEEWAELIQYFDKIVELRIQHTNLRKFDFHWIKSQRLQTLHIENNVVRRVKLIGNSCRSNLSKFSCKNCDLGDGDIKVLGMFKNTLRDLNLLGNPQITEDLVKQYCPNVHEVNLRMDRRSGSTQYLPSFTLLAVALLALNKHYAKCVVVVILWNTVVRAEKCTLAQNQVLEVLGKDDLNSCSNSITSLKIAHCEVYDVEYSAFDAFANLSYLNLMDNNLKQFYIAQNNLTKLNLSSNKLQVLDSKFLDNSPMLQDLRLEDNELVMINWELSLHHSLRTIHLERNRLTFFKLISPTMRELSLGEQSGKIQTLGGRMERLVRLDIWNSLFTSDVLADLCHLSDECLQIIASETMSHDCTQESDPERLSVALLGTEANIVYQEEEVKDIVPQRRVGCEYSTLRASPDDVVISTHEYEFIKIYIYSLIGLVFLACSGLIWLTTLYLRIIRSRNKLQEYAF